MEKLLLNVDLEREDTTLARRFVERTGLGTFEKRHAKDTVVFWPGQAEPTQGRNNHKAESIEFFKTFPDNRLINHPYKKLFQEYTLR